ncbi:MAG TPA: cytochrome c maturation protein CcmE [bacterium]|nr:cytochrome c maturation protein CcmE [bacterium]
MSRTNRKILAAVVVFVLAGAYLAYSGARNSMAYYLTVGELLDRVGTVRDADVRLSGTVSGGTIARDPVAGTLAFEVTDGTRRLPVRYRGVVPDAFKDGAEVVVEGRFDGQTFTAARLFAKCPSKFEAADKG